ncbi:MAG: flavodoxin family protein [Actinobacteria bacterium]|nr:flavodoxin family protein [Actinomycetota bacterium]MBU1942991.1 flavodoxin family protein [Actinomycetota bacterium]MBU2687769.1 flavodoxin family protein [Actinomycetota bacterium]
METKLSRVVAVNGSPRASEGMTEIVVRRFLAGAESAGAQTEVLYPAKMKIAPCLGCLYCWFRTPGVCRHKDDHPALMEKLQQADLVVFATPIYVDGMTGQMKTMFDRFVTYTPPFFEFEGHRSYHPRVGEKEFRALVISVCGFPEREHFDAVDLHFKRIFENMRAVSLGEMYFPAASIMATEPGVVEPNLQAVEAAGGEAVRDGAISVATLERANREYIDDPRVFGEKLNEIFHGLRRHHGSET